MEGIGEDGDTRDWVGIKFWGWSGDEDRKLTPCSCLNHTSASFIHT